MKAKLMVGALAIGLVAPLTVVAGPSAFGEEETVSASMSETLNPRLKKGGAILGTDLNGTIIRTDMADVLQVRAHYQTEGLGFAVRRRADYRTEQPVRPGLAEGVD